jgi:membrane protease YdiL (CAAX protease family)
MNQPQENTISRQANPKFIVTILLVIGLFILRNVLLTGTTILSPKSSIWVVPLFEIGTYFIYAILLLWERDNLIDYHIDKLALIILIFGKPLEIFMRLENIPFTYPKLNSIYYLYLVISLVLLISILITRPKLPTLKKELIKWLLFGSIAGITLGILFGNIIKLNLGEGTAGYATIKLIILLPIQQMLYAGVIEEPFFRGYLWGVLKKLGIREVWVWLIQAVLFWIAHLYYLINNNLVNTGFSFWFIIPVGSLIFGLLAWRSRSISTSIIAHGLSNGIGQIVAYYWIRIF